jgi:CdiI immunity protein
MTRGRKRSSAAFDREKFPALQEFFSGYLHEDFVDEYGSAAGAARAFCGDASPDEAAQASDEWKRLREILAGSPILELQSALQKLGGAWRPLDWEEFQAVDAVFKSKT